MKLISEAAQDDQFNKQMDKIQQAIIKLEKLALEFSHDGSNGVKPVQSQKSMLNAAVGDLQKIRAMMFNE